MLFPVRNICVVLCALTIGLLKGQSLDTICITPGTSNLSLTPTVGSSYQWQVTGGTIMSGSNTHDISVSWGSTPGLFPVSVTETNAAGCQHTYTTYIRIRDENGMLANLPELACKGELVSIEAEHGGHFLWQDPTSGSTMSVSELSFVADSDTTFSLVIDNSPCPNDTVTYTLGVADDVWGDILQSNDTILINQTISFTHNNPNPIQNTWFMDGLYASSQKNLFHQFTRSGVFEVMLELKNGSCIDTAFAFVVVEDPFVFHVPNTFTPNGDGINDVFTFYADGFTEFKAQIFNRWGQMIYEWSNDINDGWDGTFKGMPAQQDVYVYHIILQAHNGEYIDKHGNVNLIR